MKNVCENMLGTLLNMPERTKMVPKQEVTSKIWTSGKIFMEDDLI
jgi:hypothetical protein